MSRITFKEFIELTRHLRRIAEAHDAEVIDRTPTHQKKEVPHLNEPIAGMAATPDGGGYWLVASDGGVFNYGDAAFDGSTAGGSDSLTTPVVGITSSTDGRGYSLATAGGDVVPFGDGVAGGGLSVAPDPVVGISSP